MKNLLKNAGIIIIAMSILTACGNKSGKVSSNETAKEEAKAKKLSDDEKAKNMFTNTMVIFTGSMIVAFSDMFKSQSESFAEAFNAEMNDDAIKELDQKIAGLEDETITNLDKMKKMMDHAYDSLAEANRTIYEKMFLRESMKNGIALAESFELPKGFKPLTEELSSEEVKRYVFKITVDGQDTTDVIVKSFSEIALWMQEVGKELDSDEEINAFMASMKK